MAEDDIQPGDDEQPAVLQSETRRQLLLAGAAVGFGGLLAGCGSGDGGGGDTTTTATDTTTDTTTTTTTTTESSDGDDGETTTTESDEASWRDGTPVKEEIIFGGGGPWVEEINMNPFSPSGNEPNRFTAIYNDFLTHSNQHGTLRTVIVDDYEFTSPCEIVFTMKEDWNWWDGTDVTARDVITQEHLWQYNGAQPNAPQEADEVWEMTGDYEFKVSLATPTTSSKIFNGIVDRGTLDIKHEYWKGILQQFEDATTQEAIDNTSNELVQRKISLEDVLPENDALGNGFWIPSDWTPKRIIFEKNEDNPRSDWTNLKRLQFRDFGDQKGYNQAWTQGIPDGGGTLPTDRDKYAWPDDLNSWRFPISGAWSTNFNQRNKHLSDVHVRRAIAYLFSHEEFFDVYEQKHNVRFGVAPERLVGFYNAGQKQWLGQDFLDQLIDYGTTSQPEKAAQELRRGGYSKQNNEWVGPEGEPLSFTYAAPPWEGYQTAARYKAQIFSKFGMPTETKFQTAAKFWESMDGLNKGQNTDAWDMIEIWFIGAHPSDVYDTGSPAMGKANWGAITAGIDDFQFNIADKEAFQNTLTGGEGCDIVTATPEMKENRGFVLHSPIRNEIPAEIGAKTTDGETMTANLIEWDLIASQSNDAELVKETARKQAWYMNYQAQKVTTLHEVWGGWGNSRHFEWMHKLPNNTEQNEESAAVKFNKHARERPHGFVRSLTESEMNGE